MVAMTRNTAELLLLAALAAVAWVALDRGLRSPAPLAGSRTPTTSLVDPVGNGLGERSARLRAYLASPPPAGPARRNPFSFAPAPAARAMAAREPVPAPPPVETRPEMVLSGIAEDGAPGAPVRTAVISVGGQVVFVKEGDRVLSRFAVVRIAADAVQLRDTERDQLFTLAFK
jgi:hypothetical protein